MSRRPKKRIKKYSGENAKQFNRPAASEPAVHRYTAVDRNALGQWWFERKKIVRTVAIVTGIVIIVIWMIVELVNLVF